MLTHKPYVSVIIPTYNRRDLLQLAVESVLSQTYVDYELIVVDDASTDGTAVWIKSAYPTIQFISLLQNRGPAGARNVGIQAAQGELIAFLDNDDQWLPNYLAAQVNAFNERATAVMSFTDQQEIRPGLPSPKPVIYRPSNAYPDPVHCLLMGTFIYTMSVVVVRHKTLTQVGLLNETLRISHDRELYLRLLNQGDLVHVPEILVSRVFHGNNISSNHWRWATEIFMVLDLFFANPNHQSYRHLESRSRTSWALYAAEIARRDDRDWRLFLLLMAKAFWYSPGLMGQKLWRKVMGK